MTLMNCLMKRQDETPDETQMPGEIATYSECIPKHAPFRLKSSSAAGEVSRFRGSRQLWPRRTSGIIIIGVDFTVHDDAALRPFSRFSDPASSSSHPLQVFLEPFNTSKCTLTSPPGRTYDLVMDG